MIFKHMSVAAIYRYQNYLLAANNTSRMAVGYPACVIRKLRFSTMTRAGLGCKDE